MLDANDDDILTLSGEAALDFLSILFSLLGVGRDSAKRISDRRAEVAKLLAEIVGENGRALDVLNMGRLRLLRRCAVEFPDQPELADECHRVLDAQAAIFSQVLQVAQQNSESLTKAGSFIDWDLLLQRSYEMRATATRAVPYVEGILLQCDAVLDGARHARS